MPLISKLDNELSQLLKAQITFLNNPEAQGTITITLENGDIGQWINEKILKRELEDLCDLKLSEIEKAFITNIERLNPRFISYFGNNPYMTPQIVKNKGKIEEIVVSGSLVNLLLIEFPLTAILREHTVREQVRENEEAYNIASYEGIRRLQVKLDIINNTNGLNVYLGGCADRISNEWQFMAFSSLKGYTKDKVAGTDHLLTSFMLDIQPEAYVSDSMWLEHWDKKDIALNMESSNGWQGARVSTEIKVYNNLPDDFQFLVDGFNLPDAAHFAQHNQDKKIIAILDKGFLCDLDYKWENLKVIKKISTSP